MCHALKFTAMTKRLKRLLYPINLTINWFEIPPDSYEQIATARGKNVGKATGHIAKNSEFRVVTIDVVDKHRGKLYGSRMIECLIQEARAKNCNTLVFQGVGNNNDHAICLYKRLGATAMPASSIQSKTDYKVNI